MRSPSDIPRTSLLSLLQFLVVVWLLLPAAGWAQDRILQKSYWTDTTGAASFDEARLASYTPYNGVLSKGFNPYVQWVKLRVDGVLPGVSDKLVLRIRPVFLDDIKLFDPAELAQGKAARTTGDRTPLVATEFASLNHTFVIPAQQVPRDVWLRLSTTSTQLMWVFW
jgi:hypothetical protein